ncbi:hypothetical protein KDA_33550 [Dictyobacter alpinus]|uniref:non-specific serine/threonine protein kinase n=1 Tax=Dictyobacter alpinus TaxID=2014873 RepID=A0A402B917_9CHLR|nr:protein kinase [Dictyobacter alpinus]GCE27871.1 hypothetical protein KDA_33550 [Dictyobacter alpinus]
MQTQSEDQLVGHVLGQYRVERFVGKGRLQTVYLARHQALQRVDALALYHLPEHFSNEARTFFLTRFRKEASLITTLDHPHILPVYSYGEVLGSPYLITSYTTNGSLADIVKHQGRCEHTFVTSLLKQIIDGLAYAHTRGFIHGTLKPSNIVVLDDENIQVAGFGLMHILQRCGIDQAAVPYAHLLSVADTFLAAAEYVAPEIVQGQSVDQRSDIYALGCIVYELLSGRPPFSGNNPLEVAQMHVQQNIPALRKLCPDIPIALISVVNQALARDPEARFQSVSELGEAFTQASIGATQSIPAVRMRPLDVNKKVASNQQDMPRSAHTSGNWQLLPPIVTGHIPAIKSSKQDLPDGIQAGMLTSGIRRTKHLAETARPAVVAPPTIPPAVPLPAPIATNTNNNQPIVAPAKSQPEDDEIVSLPKAGVTLAGTHASDADLMKAYEWWSPVAPIQPLPTAIPQRPNNVQAPAEPVVLPATDMVDWGLETPVSTGAARQKKRSQPAPLSRQPEQKNVSRRNVLALLAVGGVAAAGVGVAFNLGKLTAPPAAPQQVAQNPQPNQPANNPAQGQQPKNPGAANPAQKPIAGHVGTVVSSKNQTVNTAIAFTNPADQQASLMIHLPDGNFAAYEKACTHEGVKVNYDPAKKLLVCPAHGAIFDPANGGKVVQGPADTPLPMVKVNVNGDGTITVV